MIIIIQAEGLIKNRTEFMKKDMGSERHHSTTVQLRDAWEQRE